MAQSSGLRGLEQEFRARIWMGFRFRGSRVQGWVRVGASCQDLDGVQSLRFRVQGFRVYGLVLRFRARLRVRFKVQGLESKVRCGVQGLGFRVQGFVFSLKAGNLGFQGLGFRIQGLVTTSTCPRISGFRFQGLGFRVQDLVTTLTCPRISPHSFGSSSKRLASCPLTTITSLQKRPTSVKRDLLQRDLLQHLGLVSVDLYHQPAKTK